MHALVEEAVDRRCSPALRGAGGRPARPPHGAFYAPAVLSGVTPAEARIRKASRSTGPLLCVHDRRVRETRRSRSANDSGYSLGASVWTADRYRGTRIARELHAGMVWINDHLPGPTVSRGPWGAAGGGGLGRTLGQAGLRACAQEKLITWDPPARRGVWWSLRRAYEPRGERRRSDALRARARPRACLAGRAVALARLVRGRSGAGPE